LYIGTGIDNKESNEDREGKEECIHLLETIEGLQKDVQIYKHGNERLMKYKEQQYGFVIAQTIGWENLDPIHKMVRTIGVTTPCYLR
jgi:hypothetical protein